MLGTAEEWDYISDNPARKTRLPRRDCDPERPVVTPQQVKCLIAALPEPARSIALLLVLTGLRIGELLALRWKNVNLDNKVLRVTESVHEGHFNQPKTRRSVCAIPLGQEAVSTLFPLRQGVSGPEQLIFATHSGRPLCRRNLLRLANDNVARLASLPRDVTERCRSAARHRAGTSRPRIAGSHTANLSACDSGRAAQSG